jgi:hypothetical protein
VRWGDSPGPLDGGRSNTTRLRARLVAAAARVETPPTTHPCRRPSCGCGSQRSRSPRFPGARLRWASFSGLAVRTPPVSNGGPGPNPGPTRLRRPSRPTRLLKPHMKPQPQVLPWPIIRSGRCAGHSHQGLHGSSKHADRLRHRPAAAARRRGAGRPHVGAVEQGRAGRARGGARRDGCGPGRRRGRRRGGRVLARERRCGAEGLAQNQLSVGRPSRASSSCGGFKTQSSPGAAPPPPERPPAPAPAPARRRQTRFPKRRQAPSSSWGPTCTLRTPRSQRPRRGRR